MFVMKTNKVKDAKTKSKYKYGFNSQIYDLNTSASFDDKLGVTRVKEPSFTFPEKIKSNASFSVEKLAGLSAELLNKADSSITKNS